MSGFRVMVVTEQPTLRRMLVEIAHERGLQAFPAADGIDALRQIYNVQPHIIVSDAALPNLSGFELLPFVRRRFPEIGVIALRENEPSLENALFIKADLILPLEPFNPALFSDLLVGLASEFPFRAQLGPNEIPDANGPRIVQRPDPAATCSQCDDLQRKAGVARMNALLARAWDHLHPNEEASSHDTEAELAFNLSLSELRDHQQHAHGRRPQPEEQPHMDDPEAVSHRRPRYANG